MQDITIQGETFNTNNAVLYSKYGDITITNQNVSLNGLVYAPFGDVRITAQNLNLNQIVIIADTITLECPNVNANYNADMGIFLGNVSEELYIPEDEYKYLQDTDGDGLQDIIEEEIGSDPCNADTDGDGLPDDYEGNSTGTDPTRMDTDGNGVMDCDEKFMQTYRYEVPKEDCAVSEVHISMSATGNLNTCTEIESVMGRDVV